MKQKTKKKIAKEIIILFSSFIIATLVLVGILLRNVYFDNKIYLTDNKIKNINKSIDSIEKQLNSFDESYLTVFFETYLLPKRPYANFNDWIYRIKSNEQYKKGMFENHVSPKNPNLSYDDWCSKVFGIDSTKSLSYNSKSHEFVDSLANLKFSKDSLTDIKNLCYKRKYTMNESWHFTYSFYILIIILLYPTRFFILLIIWAIKILKEPKE